MSLRHFKRLNCSTSTAKNITNTSEKEVCIIKNGSNTDNDINNMKTSETAVENCCYNNFVSDNPIPHDQTNLPQEIGLEIDTFTDTLGSNNMNYTTCNNLALKTNCNSGC